jgi:hypothetical protein
LRTEKRNPDDSHSFLQTYGASHQSPGEILPSSIEYLFSVHPIISKGAHPMTIAQQNQRLLALFILFAILATILLAVLWFEGSQLINVFWHTAHGIAAVGFDIVSHRP